MNFSKIVWDQLKNLSADELVATLIKDGFVSDTGRGAQKIFTHADGRRVSVHYHPGKTYGPKLLRALFDDIGWKTADLRRLKLIK